MDKLKLAATTGFKKGREGWEGDTTFTNAANDWGVKISTWKGHRGISSSYQFCDFEQSSVSGFSSFKFEMFGNNPRYKRGQLIASADRCTEANIKALHTKAIDLFTEQFKEMFVWVDGMPISPTPETLEPVNGAYAD